jgi:hypothetical protein
MAHWPSAGNSRGKRRGQSPNCCPQLPDIGSALGRRSSFIEPGQPGGSYRRDWPERFSRGRAPCRRCAAEGDRAFGFLRRYTVTHAAAHGGGQLGAVLDRDNTASDVWADTADRSAANVDLLERRGPKPQFQRKSRGATMPM